VVGRVGRWDVGFLDMQTAPPEETPGENLGVLRLRRQVLNENSYVGGILTSRIDREGGHNFVYGLDGILRLAEQDYLTLNWAQSFDSDVGGEVSAWEQGLARLHWERRGVDGLSYFVQATRAGAEFRPELGFLLRDDYVSFGDGISYGWRMDSESILLRHTLALNGMLYRRSRDGRVESAEWGPEWIFETKSGHEFTAAASMSYEDIDKGFGLSNDAGVPVGVYRFFNGRLSYSSGYGDLFRVVTSVDVGSFYDGRKTSFRMTPTWKVSDLLQLSGSYRVDLVKFPERNERFTAHIARFRTRVTLTTHIAAYSFIQYNSAADAVILNVRLRYNPKEGNDFYLVYNEGLNTDRYDYRPALPRTDTRTLLLKYSHTFDLGF
jgi:hypothetical protein